MSQKRRKYLSEFAVNLYSARWLMLPASQVNRDAEMSQEEADVSKHCHIYLICERPALSFDKDDFQYKDGRIKGSVIYRIDGALYRENFDLEFPLIDGAVELRLSKYPHREIQTIDSEGNQVRYLSASTISVMHDPYNYEHIFRKLKVLYVGQAFGGGNRTAHDRLKSHSTLQKILAEASYNSPDSEIMVMMFEYAPYRVISNMNGFDKTAISDERDSARYRDILSNPLKLGEQISLAEAALIRYFQPVYNKIYRKKFPSRELKVLADCYKYDFSGLIVEINTDDFHFSLYSETIAPKMHHSANIDLVDYEQRWGFFHLEDGKGRLISPVPIIGSGQNSDD